MIHHKGRLDQMILHKFLKEQVEDIALLVDLFELHMLLLCDRSRFLERMDLIKVNAGIFLHGIHHRNPLKRLGQIHRMLAVGDALGITPERYAASDPHRAH